MRGARTARGRRGAPLAALGIGTLVALVALEIGGRAAFRGTPYLPGEEILRIQAQLTEHPRLGFLWNSNVSERDAVLVSWRDAEPFLLTTDEHGFLNPPEAIAANRRGETFDVVGLGDSFIHDAAETFHDSFAAAGLAYYSLAMHRHSPPQYNRILEAHALTLEPRWLLYGISQNDYTDAADFLTWERSGRDWFEYHSGTWCGPPPSLIGWGSLAPGLYSSWRAALNLAGRVGSRSHPERRREVTEIAEYALSAHRASEARGIHLLVLLIPEKQTSLRGVELSPNAHDQLRALLRAAGVSVFDLRPSFRDHPDRRSLFHQLDGHWNRNGMLLAASKIVAQLNASSRVRHADRPDR